MKQPRLSDKALDRLLARSRAAAKQAAKPTIEDYTEPAPGFQARAPAPRSDAIPGGLAPARNVLLDHRWKQGRQETEQAVKEAEAWAKRVAPVCNKGGYAVIGAGEQTSVGRKL